MIPIMPVRLKSSFNVIALDDTIVLRFHLLFAAKSIGRLLQLPLSLFEEETLLKHLANCSDLISQELLVMYYLQKSRILEAFTLNENLKRNVLVSSVSV